MADAVAYGARLALEYNPLLALLGATLAAALLAPRDRSLDRTVWGASSLLVAWLIGDGLRVIARARDLYDSATPVAGDVAGLASNEAGWVAIAVWALLGFALGYALPAWAGAFVGRRVTHGTGWLAAASIAVGTSLALSTIAAFVAG